MSAPVVKLAGPLAIDAVMPIMGQAFDPSFGEAWSRGQCLGMLTLPDVWLMTGAMDDRSSPAGFALARRTLDEAELLLIAVLPETRGRGLGRALIEATADEAQLRGAGRLMLEVRSTNPAIRLYTIAGFEQVGRRKDYYRGAGGQLNDALTLSRTLDPR